MAITPEQAGVLTAEEKDALSRGEEIIDKILSSRFSEADGGRVIVYSSELIMDLGSRSGLTRRVMDRLLTLYEASGWIIGYTSDQKDGDFYSFTPA